MMMPSMYALAGSLWPDGGRRPFNAVYVAQNVGVSLGTALIAVITLVRLTDVFIANALMYVGLLIFVVIFSDHLKRSNRRQQTRDCNRRARPLKSNIGCMLCYSFALLFSFAGSVIRSGKQMSVCICKCLDCRFLIIVCYGQSMAYSLYLPNHL